MKIQCSTCSARYSVANDRVAGRHLEVRCRKCGDTMVVRGPDAIWHVSNDGAQEGPFTIRELAEHVVSDAESFVWHEGLEDWVSAREVAELAHLFSDNETATDLFAPRAGDIFAGPDEPATTPAVASILTGARNESSVLFSLSNLSALSNDAPLAPTAAGAPTTEGSGLIDIRKLALAMATSPEPAGEDIVDELLGFGGSDLASLLGAPVTMPAHGPSTSKLPIVIGSAFAAVVAIAAGVVVAVVQLDREQLGREQHAGNDEMLVDEGVDLGGPIGPGAITHQPSEPSEPTGVATPEPEPEPEAVPEPEPEAAPRVSRPRPRSPRLDPRPQQHRRVPPPATDDDDPITEILGPRRAPPREPVRQLPERPSRGDVTGAMTAITPAVRACGDGNHGFALVNASFGSNGRVRSVDVSGSLAGPVRSCVARAVRGARVPEFSRSSFRVTYPFRL